MIDVYLRLISHILARPKYVRHLDALAINYGDYSKIIDIVRDYPGDGIVTPTYLIEKGIDKKITSLIYPLVSESISMSDIEAYSDLYNCLILIDEQVRRKEILNVLDKAKNLVISDRIAEAIYLLKSLKYPPTKRLKKFDEFKKSNDSVLVTGVQDIDECGLMLGNMLVLSGDTGSMKTMVSLWLCISILNNTDYRVGFFEKEMLPRDIILRIISNLTGKRLSDIMSMDIKEYNNLHDYTYEKYKNILDRFVIIPNDSFDNVLDMAKIIENEGINVFVLDFFTQLGQERMDRDFTTFTMSQANMLKEMINTTNTLGIIITQLRKNSARVRMNKIPLLDDIEWSGSISQYASYVYSTFYPKLYYEKMNDKYFYLINTKNRHNAVRDVCLHSYPQYCNFLEPDPPDKVAMINWLNTYKQR